MILNDQDYLGDALEMGGGTLASVDISGLAPKVEFSLLPLKDALARKVS